MANEPPGLGAPDADRVGIGIASILAAVLFFSIADATAKWLGQTYAPAQIVFLRYLFGLVPVALFVWQSGGPRALATRRPFAHAARALLIFAALLMLFAGLRGLPLAEAISIAFTAPLFVTALSGPVLGETVRPRRWAAVGIGFIGALIIVRPGPAAFRFDALYILGSALCFALSALVTRRMARTETTVAMLAYTTLGAGIASVPLMPFVWRQPAAADLWLFLLIGMAGGTAAYFLIAAYRHAPAALVAPFDYTGLIWAALFGWLVWREQPEPIVWLGAAIIALSGLYMTYRETAADRETEKHT
jgi:drug/metabolite transporter (DMT)-like permease